MTISSILMMLQLAVSLLTSAQAPGVSENQRQAAVAFATRAVALSTEALGVFSAPVPVELGTGGAAVSEPDTLALTPQPTSQSSTQTIQETSMPEKVEAVTCKVIEPTNQTAWHTLSCDSSFDAPVNLRSLVFKSLGEESRVNVTFGINSNKTSKIETVAGEKEILCPSGYCKLLPNVNEQKLITWETNSAFPVKLEKITVYAEGDKWVELQL